MKLFDPIFLRTWRPYAWIVLVGFLLYFKAIFFGYTYLDDNNLILENIYFLHDISNIIAAFGQDVFRLISTADIYYRPLMTVSLILDAQIGGAAPFIYHFTNLLIHLLGSCLVFLLLNKIGCKRELSFVFSLIFAIHPALSQAVAWIPGRNDSLMAVFALLSFIFFIDYAERKKYGHCFCILYFSPRDC